MQIDCLVLGEYQTNCYILRESKQASDCLLIDAGLEPKQLVEFLQAHKLNPVGLILTHGHIDHVGGIAILRKKFPNIKVYIHKLDEAMLTNTVSNLSALIDRPFTAGCADFCVEQGDVIEVAGIRLQVLHTPGHTPGGICLYSKESHIVFTDDTLFTQSIGRTDFPGGNMAELIKSIKEKLLVLPDNTVVYPGHGPATTIGREKLQNQYLQ